MCIRDSYKEGDTRYVYVKNDEGGREKRIITTGAVSYTHLDVYKRQVNEKSQYCFFVCTTFDSFLNDFSILSAKIVLYKFLSLIHI